MIRCKVTGDESEDAFSGQTVPLDVEESEKVAKAVTANSRRVYAKQKTAIEKQMSLLFDNKDNGGEYPVSPGKNRITRKQSSASTKQIFDL